MARLAGEHAVVTGGARGIGLACARALAEAGAAVTLIGRDAAALDAAAADLPRAAGLACDVTDAQAVAGAFVQAAAAHGPVDILVANAGASESAPFLKTAPEAMRRMLDVNLMGVFHCMQAALPGMIEAGRGRIVAVASTASLKGYAYVAPYCAAKHAVLGLVRAVALETAKTGVTVNAVCPGFADTEMTARTLETIQAKTGRSREAALASLTAGNPQGRLVAPEEVADAVLWLCGIGAHAITGQAVPVDGGELVA